MKAKDAVEKIPGILKANVVKKDAEAIKEQLAKVGCKVNLKWFWKYNLNSIKTLPRVLKNFKFYFKFY